jgi:hypothetical protein
MNAFPAVGHIKHPTVKVQIFVHRQVTVQECLMCDYANKTSDFLGIFLNISAIQPDVTRGRFENGGQYFD